MAVVAGCFARPDFMPLDARHRGRRRSIVREEEQTAAAVAELTLFPLQPREGFPPGLFQAFLSSHGVDAGTES